MPGIWSGAKPKWATGKPLRVLPRVLRGLEDWLQPSLRCSVVLSLLVDLFCSCHSSMKKMNGNGKFPDLMPHTVQVSKFPTRKGAIHLDEKFMRRSAPFFFFFFAVSHPAANQRKSLKTVSSCDFIFPQSSINDGTWSEPPWGIYLEVLWMGTDSILMEMTLHKCKFGLRGNELFSSVNEIRPPAFLPQPTDVSRSSDKRLGFTRSTNYIAINIPG